MTLRKVICDNCGMPTWVETIGCTHCGAVDTTMPPEPIADHPATARCVWEVTAGVIAGMPDPEHTKRWVMSSGDPDERFMELHTEAHEYADSVTDPRVVNWVRVDWVWF